MADAKPITAPAKAPEGATGVLVLSTGDVIWGHGFGAEGAAVGEVCFHTAMTGYQEIMTDPSFAGQMITFTFPHIGNVGANPDDLEADDPHAVGIIVREKVTGPSNFRSTERLDAWMAKHGRIGLAGVDTRALTRRIRGGGAPNGVIAHSASGTFDVAALLAQAQAWPGLEGMDLAIAVTTAMDYGWDGGVWRLGAGYDSTAPLLSSPLPLAGGVGGGTDLAADAPLAVMPTPQPPPASGKGEQKKRPHVVAIDYGSKRNIFRNLVAAGADVSVVPATASFEQIIKLAPDGIFLSNGPGDPAATGVYAVPVIQQLLETGKPLFGICLGHQLLALAVGASTTKMFQGHRGANHPVKRLSDGAVEITSMNHGFAVERESLPATARATHVSLFDGSNAGIELTDRPAFSVQYHPEASPGPQDSLYLFEKFVSSLKVAA
ncbi:glutamine-hydrolyzing carbamoyl-phosphate synthase small subunit [Sphingomonas psychrolutea]|uniref:Carbamoyl phosphate synthase small chain n=1 Tax=Sphingomonas psychrolutea TaxID=1259676 RepID=A0ABQ1H3B6_9SPHN|nr:glutamine-hydrolyzing carbamoyl-phosphate synthase small subunit [Sphingomonas psychrolutea]GGA57349.1 carbamoyl-phosphate synthase small chain [Sphingomonas psychrolutea]